MKDPWVDAGCRAWLPCPHCPSTTPLWLLATDINVVFVQCPGCLTRCYIDTGCGVGHRPPDLTPLGGAFRGA